MSLLRFSRCGGRALCIAKNVNKSSTRNAIRDTSVHQTYREQPVYNPPWVLFMASAVPAIYVIYIGYNLYRHPHHYLGEFPKIEPSKWTDEELGIPPDDEDIYPPGYVPLKDRK